jgi:hypothetical protein
MSLSSSGVPYNWLCITLLPCVVGKKAWSRRRTKELMSEIVTASDESFVLLALDNNYHRWMAETRWMLKNKDKDPEQQDNKEFPEAKYTNSGKNRKNGRSKRLSGWSREGFLKFNELHKHVLHDRRQRAGFERELMAQLRKEGESTSRKQTKETVAEEEIFPANDWDELDALPRNPVTPPSNYTYNNYNKDASSEEDDDENEHDDSEDSDDDDEDPYHHNRD